MSKINLEQEERTEKIGGGLPPDPVRQPGAPLNKRAQVGYGGTNWQKVLPPEPVPPVQPPIAPGPGIGDTGPSAPHEPPGRAPGIIQGPSTAPAAPKQPDITQPHVVGAAGDEQPQTRMQEYKDQEELKDEKQLSLEEVGIMASRYPYFSLYRGLTASKKVGSPWYVLQNQGRVVAIVPADPRATTAQHKIVTQRICEDVATRGLVATLKAHNGRVAQAGDPGVVGGAVKDFIELVPANSGSVLERSENDMTTKRTEPGNTTVVPPGPTDNQVGREPKTLGDDLLNERTTDFASDKVIPPGEQNVTDLQESDMRVKRPGKTVGEPVIEGRVTDMKIASRNPWVRKAAIEEYDAKVKDMSDDKLEEESASMKGDPTWEKTEYAQAIAREIGKRGLSASRRRPQMGGAGDSDEKINKDLDSILDAVKDGLTPEEISAKLNLPIDMVKYLIETFSDEAREARRRAVCPPGLKNVVKELKKDPGVDNPYAVAWGIKDKQEEKKGRRAQGDQALPPEFKKEMGDVTNLPEDKQPEKSAQSIAVSSEDFNAIVADLEGRMAQRQARQSETWKRAYKERFNRALLLAADRQRLNQEKEPCALKVAMGDVLFEGGFDENSIYRIIESAFNTGGTKFAESLIRQALKFVDMPQEAFLAIEADTKKLRPVDVRKKDDDKRDDKEDEHEEHERAETPEEERGERLERAEARRRQAARGNMFLAPSPVAAPAEPSARFPGIRQALRTPLTDKFPVLLGR